MKTEKNILLAFILNLLFSIFEFVGGAFSGSVAIVSDAVHDAGDALSIGVAYFLERKSKKQPDQRYTYGYARFSVLGGFITTLILLFGSAIVIYNAIVRIIYPVQIDYNGMIVIAVVGVVVNFIAAVFTRGGHSLNQKAVNLHMLEDVLGWIVVLIGAVVMKFTNFAILDPIVSIAVALFIVFNGLKNVREALNLFLEKAPSSVDVTHVKEHLCKIDGVVDVHHVHVWSLDHCNNYATMHVVTDQDFYEIKAKVRKELSEHGINHVTIELENTTETCEFENCVLTFEKPCCHHHHH